jgi:putative addiction module component (TIGR02574 family)
MPYNLSEIKKLPNPEKLRIIDELWKSIEDNMKKEVKESPEIISMLEERLEEYEKKGRKTASWDEVEKRLKKKMAQWKKKQNV